MVAIVLAALGGALYYLFEMRKSTPATVSFRDNLIGTWKIDSVALSQNDSGNVLGLTILALDSNYLKYTYQFDKEGFVVKNLADTTVEKLNYQLKDSTHLTFIAGDSTNEEFHNTIVSFDAGQFTLLASDSSLLFFKRQK